MRRLIAAMLLVGVLGTEAMAEKKTTAPTAKTAQTNVADRTGNISKRHREDLLRKIMEIREFFNRSDDKNAVRLRQFADLLAREVRGKKYGLVFEEHRERADVELENNLPILKENAKRFIDHGGEMNFLIEGENLAALKLLEKTHRNRVDFIYIDPPYNTGNKDFIYNDSYVDAKDTFRHSKWLSFMEKRLKIARTLLTRKGVLFVSIDDTEFASLRILLDTIFGEKNFVGNIIWQSATDNNPRQISTEHEYIICFAKDLSQQGKWLMKSAKAKVIADKYAELRKETDDVNLIQKKLRAWINENKEAFKGVAHYNNVDEKGVYSSSSNSSNTKPGGYTFDIIHPVTHKPCSKPAFGWRWTEETFLEYAKNGEVEWGKDETTQPHIKKRIETVDEQFKSIYYEDGRAATTMLEKLLGKKRVFTNPKPIELISRFLNYAAPTNATVLDFFAGSGTTGHAVMRLNAQDGGRRRFILITDNENGICENVTYERLKRAIKNEGLKARLKYMKIDYLPITERLYYEYADDLLKNVRELVELENAVDFAHDASVAIVRTDAEYAAFLADEKRLAACRVLYVGHHVLRSAASEATLSARNVELREIPQYYYPELED